MIGGVLWWFRKLKGIENDRIAKVYVRVCPGSRSMGRTEEMD